MCLFFLCCWVVVGFEVKDTDSLVGWEEGEGCFEVGKDRVKGALG